MSRRRKIIISILVLAALAGAAYYFFSRRETPIPGTPPRRIGLLPDALNRILGRPTPPPRPIQPTPISPASRLRERLYHISQEPAFPPMIAPSQNAVRYVTRAKGELWQSDFEGLKPERLSDATAPNIVEVIWSSLGDKMVLTAQDQADAPKKFLYDAAEKKSTELSRHMRAVAFSPKGDKIVYHYLNIASGEDVVAIANPDGSNFKTVFRPLFGDFTLFWPKEDMVVIQTKPSYAALTRLYGLNVKTGVLTKILPQDFPGLDTAWSKDGTKLFASRATSDGEPSHALAGTLLQAQPKELFGVNTLAQKCVWKDGNAAVICGIPSAFPAEIRLPDDYYKGILVSADNIVEIRVETLSSRVIARSQEIAPVLDVDSPVLSPDESRIFFTNRQDGYVYALRL